MIKCFNHIMLFLWKPPISRLSASHLVQHISKQLFDFQWSNSDNVSLHRSPDADVSKLEYI